MDRRRLRRSRTPRRATARRSTTRSDAQYERMKRAAEKQKAEEAAAVAALQQSAPVEPVKVVATNLLAKQKHAIDTLFSQRRPMTNDDLRVLGFGNVGPLFDPSRRTKRWSTTKDGLFRYKAKHDVLCKQDVLELVNSMPDGLGVDEILDSYVKAKEDALALAEQDDALILLANTEAKKKVLFRKQPDAIELNEEFVGDFHDVEIPQHDVDFDKALRREGIEPTPRPVYDLGRRRGGEKEEEAAPSTLSA